MTLVSDKLNFFYIFEIVSDITIVKVKWGGWNRRICSFSDAVSLKAMLYLRKFRK